MRLLAEERSPLRLSDVQRKTGLQKTIAFRLLKTLQAHGFVEQEADSGGFQIGISAFEVGQAYPRGGSLLRIARPFLRTLVGQSPHTAYLAALDGFEIVYLAAVEGTGPLRVSVSPGHRGTAYATAVGKVLLAELSDEEIAELARNSGLRALTPATITNVAKLTEHLHEVRERGYALNSEEAYPGIGSVGAVVRDGAGRAVAGLSIAYATSLLPAKEVPAWVTRTTSAAAEISAQLERITIHDRDTAA